MYRRSLVLGLLLIATCGCRNMSHTESSALGGGAIGAGVGALAGKLAGNTAAGALIGSGVGAVAGAARGAELDRAEKRAAAHEYNQIQYQQAVQAQQKRQVTIGDVLHMSQQGVEDRLIVNQIRATNSMYDLSPQDVVLLKKNFVSANVIDEMQKRRRTGAAVVVQPSPVVERRVIHVVEPQPRPVIGIGYYSRPYGHYHRRRCGW